MQIIDTYPALLASYEGGEFRFSKWRSYIDAELPRLAEALIDDAKPCLASGEFSWEGNYLPVLNAVARENRRREAAHDSFLAATQGLERRIRECFGRDIDATLVFYLGLCNGAGWMTRYRGRTAVLLGVEKILELDWGEPDDMRALIYHELGHAFQEQYGVLERRFERSSDRFLWQLFTEGVAMVFEQTLLGDPEYFHQDRDGWKDWCEAHLAEIKADFRRDLAAMTFDNQHWFGDWVSYRGRADVGYYLGARFVRFLLGERRFDKILSLDIETVARLFERFLAQD